MQTYAAYDVRICSDLTLPELEIADGEPDVTITLGKVSPVPVPIGADGSGFWATGDEACYFLEDVGTFLVRGGREVVVELAPRAEPGRIRLSILGPVLGILLHQRGHLVLHASCVEIEGRAVAFAGNRGWGKSTIAAALYARGHGIVSDDVTAIDLRLPVPSVMPAFPQIKLWPDSVPTLGPSADVQPRFHPLLDKRGFRVTRGFPQGPVALERVYVLAEGADPGVDKLRPGEAFPEILRHWYGGRFGDGLLKAEGAAVTHFEQAATLAARVPMRRLRSAGSASPALTQVDLVEADLRD
jgi:hypothetical protein